MTEATHPKHLSSAALGVVALLALALPSKAQNTSGVPVPRAPTFDRSDPQAYGTALAEYSDAFDRGWLDQYSKATMTLFDARGDYVTRDVRRLIKEGTDGDMTVSRFMSPPDIRGVSALIHEHPQATDDSWLYLPASRRVRRISGANRTASFQGTEFTYEDLSSLVPSRYDFRFLADEQLKSQGSTIEVAKLEARPNYRDTGYSKLVVYLNRAQWRTERIEYFDLAGRKLKTLSFSQWKHYHGRFWRALRLSMENHQTRKRTVLQTQSLFVNMALYQRRDGTPRDNLRDSLFTRAAREKL